VPSDSLTVIVLAALSMFSIVPSTKYRWCPFEAALATCDASVLAKQTKAMSNTSVANRRTFPCAIALLSFINPLLHCCSDLPLKWLPE
jgi:hypothetical protein